MGKADLHERVAADVIPDTVLVIVEDQHRVSPLHGIPELPDRIHVVLLVDLDLYRFPRKVCFRTSLMQVDIRLWIGDGDAFLVETLFHSLDHIKMEWPVIISLRPYPDRKID